ncbi:MAG: hypothetical protein QGF68_13250 [Nitrospinota bacterium]|nr:hypothetical protein [Nitrospinota bacterium]MDP7386264.1 hypothetical protein [Nitrospinota bacterium]
MEALVRGLLESGVTYATGCPGGPASVDKALLPVLESAGAPVGSHPPAGLNRGLSPIAPDSILSREREVDSQRAP